MPKPSRTKRAYSHFREHPAYRFPSNVPEAEYSAIEANRLAVFRQNLRGQRFLRGDRIRATRGKNYVGAMERRKAFFEKYAREIKEFYKKRGAITERTEEASARHWDSGGPIQDFHDMRHNYLLLRRALRKFPLPKGARVASVGCGVGSQELLLAEEFPTISVKGVDVSTKLIRDAKALADSGFGQVKQRVAFNEGSFNAPNLKSKGFDFVMSVDAFHWAENRLRALENLKGLIDPKSQCRLLYLCYRERPTARFDKKIKSEIATDMRFKSLERDLKTIGFRILSVNRPRRTTRVNAAPLLGAPVRAIERTIGLTQPTNSLLPDRYNRNSTVIVAQLE